MQRGSHEKREKIYIYGRHALTEALNNAPQAVRKAFLSSEVNDPALRELLATRNIQASAIKSREADHMVGADTSHQGVIAIVDPSALLVEFDAFMQGLRPTERTLLVLLDELTDPHNVGAVIRSAAAFGAAGVLLPAHRQAPVTGAVVKASAGMAFRVPIVSIGNVNLAVDRIKKENFSVYGLAMEGAKELGEELFAAPTLFIIGNEGKGIREKTLERCDVTLRIPMDPRCESLNASVSAGIALYAWSAMHKNEGSVRGIKT